MIHLYVRLTLLPVLLLTVALLLIRAQPYDDHELRALLLPEGCPAPCFMGEDPVRPFQIIKSLIVGKRQCESSL